MSGPPRACGEGTGRPTRRSSRTGHPTRSSSRRGSLWTLPELWKTPRTRFPQLLGRRTERAAHNGPQASFFSFRKHKNKTDYNDARHSGRLIDNTDVLASLRSDHDAAEPVITMLWNT